MIAGFKCTYCGNFGLDPAVIEAHERSCHLNPDTHICYTCAVFNPCLTFLDTKEICTSKQNWQQCVDNHQPCPAWEPGKPSKLIKVS